MGEKINVTRQTISNWELNETSPNLEQLRIISKELNVSIDELLDNDIQSVLVEKGSNIEKLAGLVLKVLKYIGATFIVFLIIDVVTFILFIYIKNTEGGFTINKVEEVELECSIEKNDYIISVGSDGYFNCSNCSKELQKELKDKYIDFGDIEKTLNNVIKYFENNNGICE